MQKIILYILMLCYISSCQKTESSTTYLTNSSIDSSWYPHPLGMWWEYQLDSTFFYKSSLDSTVSIITKKTYQKEEIIEQIEDFQDGTSYKIALSQKQILSDNYTFYRYIVLRFKGNQIIKNDGQYDYIKLVFPIKNNFSWNGNNFLPTDSFNTFWGTSKYQYQGLFNQVAVGNMAFDSTITVLQIVDSNAIELKYSSEIYSKKIGLISKNFKSLQKQNTSNFWDFPENGFTVNQTLLDYKK